MGRSLGLSLALGLSGETTGPRAPAAAFKFNCLKYNNLSWFCTWSCQPLLSQQGENLIKITAVL